MRKNYTRLIFSLLIISLMASCSKEGPTGPTGPAGPAYTGTISGHVLLFDKYGSPVLTGLNSVQLVLSGGAATFAGSDGGYSFASVKTNNYYITATDTLNHFAGTVINNVNFVAGTLYRDVKLSAIPDSFITAFASIQAANSDNDSLVIHVVPDTRARNCIVFMHNASTVANVPSNYLLHYVRSIPANAGSITVLIPQQDMLNAGITAGAKVYYAVYSYVVNDVSAYEDETTGKNVYNAVNLHPLVDSVQH